LWQVLGDNAPWRGKIHLDLHRVRSSDEMITVVSEKFKNGWNYRVKLPDVLQRDRFILTLTEVLLLEIANRNAGDHPAVIPAWLTEGFAGELRASGGTELLLTPPDRSVNGLAFSLQNTHQFWSNPLEQAWQELRARPALTFEQLSWPAEGQFDGDAGRLFRASAQLLVNRLLRLENGQACFQAMLQGLPRRYNWQLAFQAAFRPYFQSPLDVEKWWALQVAQFTGHDLTQTWTLGESWRKLDEILRPPVEVRAGENELPLHAEVSLQTSLREWDRARQVQMLQRKLAELNLLRPRVVAEVVPLVDDYRGAIQNYLRKREASTGILFFKQRRSWIYDRLAEETIQQLDALDAVREALRPAAAAVAAGRQAAVP
jgi:hypothetical protein